MILETSETSLHKMVMEARCKEFELDNLYLIFDDGRVGKIKKYLLIDWSQLALLKIQKANRM